MYARALEHARLAGLEGFDAGLGLGTFEVREGEMPGRSALARILTSWERFDRAFVRTDEEAPLLRARLHRLSEVPLPGGSGGALAGALGEVLFRLGDRHVAALDPAAIAESLTNARYGDAPVSTLIVALDDAWDAPFLR